MSDAGPAHLEAPGPSELRDPLVRRELARAGVWLGLAAAILLAWLLAQPLLLIAGGIVFAAMLDGGARLLGRVLPIGRGWRLAIVVLLTFAFLAWTFVFAGLQLAEQAQTLRTVLTQQIDRVFGYATQIGLVEGGGQGGSNLGSQLMGSLGRLTTAVGSAVGAVTSLFMMIVIGIFVAAEPRLYDRGVAWMMPMRARAGFYTTAARMAATLRRLMAGRLLGMAVEGVGTWLLCLLAGIPMAGLLGLLTGLLAFVPNIGAVVSGVLLIAVGFSAGTDTGIWAIGIYLAVQVIDGYLIVPMVAKRTVDLAPALVLGAQLLLGALFGILGLALADPLVATIKTALERASEDTPVSPMVMDEAGGLTPAVTVSRPEGLTPAVDLSAGR